jgi:class 3 adenylate cyclase
LLRAYSAAVPSLVSLLVTDIVDSTRLWARYERVMVAGLVVHDDAVAKIVDLYGGRVFKRTGDGAMAVFEDPVAAVTAGSEIQRALRSMTWQTEGGIRARVAVHAGTVIERDGDCFGTAVNRAARLVRVCPPGAVVVSGVTAELMADWRTHQPDRRSPQSTVTRGDPNDDVRSFPAEETTTKDSNFNALLVAPASAW